MVNAGCTLHSDLPVVALDTKRVKEPSPSVNPVTNQGLREDLEKTVLPFCISAMFVEKSRLFIIRL